MKNIYFISIAFILSVFIIFIYKFNQEINETQVMVNYLSDKISNIETSFSNNQSNIVDEILNSNNEILNINKLELNQKQLHCLNIAVLGEHSKSSDKEIEIFIYWFVNQAKKNNRTICEEFHSKAAGGALKYSSATLNHIIRSLQESQDTQDRISKLINNVLNNFKEDEFSFIYEMNNYLTLDLAKSKRAPKWHKEHLVDYVIIDNTFYGKYDWNKKTELFKKVQID